MAPDLPTTVIIKKETYSDLINKIPGGESSITLIEEIGTNHILVQFYTTDPHSDLELEPKQKSKDFHLLILL